MGGVGALKMGQNAHKNRGDNLHVNILFNFFYACTEDVTVSHTCVWVMHFG